MSKQRTIARVALSTLLSGCIIGAGICLAERITKSAYSYTEDIIISESDRVNNSDVSKTTLTVTDQTTIDDIAENLFSADCITNKDYFILEAKLSHNTTGFIPGEYSISSNMSSNKILSLLTTNITGENETVKFTIPEGYTISQIGDVLETKEIVTKDAFIDAVINRDYSSEYSFLQEIPANRHYKYTLEGYLFPDTYIVHKGISPEEIIIMMLNRFEEIFNRYKGYANSSNYSIHELLTIASIVEQEAKLDEERPMIAGVVYNRLNANMNLQMCSTIQYALTKRKSSLTLDDLQVESDYNTYLNSGLPIGPICNPGEACIKAALMPSEHDYYYFVVEDSEVGSHYFSSSNEEHIAAKSRYRQSEDINFAE